MIHPQHLALGLEQAFSRIHTQRMRGLPFLNPELSVQAVGFRRWEEDCLGVLITTWFMNLMLLSCEGDGWSELPAWSVVKHHFPSGVYEFIVGEEPGIGRFQLCSLFSPMLAFENQPCAVATAQAALSALMEPQNREVIDGAQKNLPNREKTQLEPDQINVPAGVNRVQNETTDRGISRRDLITGVFRGGV